MRIGNKVLTVDDPGIIIDIEKTDLVKRYIVKLDVNKYEFNPGCYPGEIEKAG